MPPRLNCPCIICSNHAGTIQTKDGFVCKACMPRELLPKAEELSGYQLQSFYKLNRNRHWANCEIEDMEEVTEADDDRSRVITNADSIVLADDLNKQIRTADSIDIVVSFILCSGLNLLIDSLYEFTRHGKLRVITTTYMGNTEYEALEQLIRLPNTQVKIELNSLEHRLHAKAFLFNRSDGTSVAYVGSANISKSALTTGEEWVVKIREQDCCEPIYDVRSSFEYLWNNYQFVTVTPTNRAQIESAIMNGGK